MDIRRLDGNKSMALGMEENLLEYTLASEPAVSMFCCYRIRLDAISWK